MRTIYWYLTAYARKHGPIILITLIAGIAFFSLILPNLITRLEQRNRQFIGVIGEYSLDHLPPEVTKLISVGLTTINDDGTTGRGVAERYTAEDDGRTYRFIIREDLVWQDGKPLVPTDINYNFRDVEVIHGLNDIVFKLRNPFVPFPTVVADPLIRQIEERYLLFMSRPMPVGLGAYRVVDYQLNNNRLSELVLDGPGERLIFRFYLTQDQAMTAFKHGRVDVLADISRPTELMEWPNVTISPTVRFDRYLALFFNNASPMFPRNIRQAFAYAMEKPSDDTRAIGPINPRSWAYLESGRRYDYDYERAIERMIDEIPGVPLEFRLTTNANFAAEAEEIKVALERLGNDATERCFEDSNDDNCDHLRVKIQIQVTNFPDTSNFDTLLIGQQIPPDPDQYYLWHSEQTTNFSRFKNTRIDALLERGRTTAESNERRAIYQEFQQFFLEDIPAVFIRHLTSYQVERG